MARLSLEAPRKARVAKAVLPNAATIPACRNHSPEIQQINLPDTQCRNQAKNRAISHVKHSVEDLENFRLGFGVHGVLALFEFLLVLHCQACNQLHGQVFVSEEHFNDFFVFLRGIAEHHHQTAYHFEGSGQFTELAIDRPRPPGFHCAHASFLVLPLA